MAGITKESLFSELGDYLQSQFSVDINEFNLHGSLVDCELKFILDLVQLAIQHEGPIVELGALFGYSTIQIAAAAPEREIISVDNFSWNPYGLRRSQHKKTLNYFLDKYLDKNKYSIVKKVTKIKNTSPCLVFIDSSHTYRQTCKEIKWALKNEATFIAGHDYVADFPGVIKAVNEFGGALKLERSCWLLDTPRARKYFVDSTE